MVRHTKFFSLFLCLCLLPLLFSLPLFAQTPEQTYADGVMHLFNLDFPEAETAFLTLTKAHPDNPDYWNVLGTTYWLKILYSQQKLNIESFSGKSHFGTAESKDSGYEVEEKQFREAVDKAMAAADAMIMKDPKSL